MNAKVIMFTADSAKFRYVLSSRADAVHVLVFIALDHSICVLPTHNKALDSSGTWASCQGLYSG